MKTTLDIADDVLIAAKKRSAELRLPLREIVERALRRELANQPATKKLELKPHTAPGSIPFDASNRETMFRWMDEQ